MDSIGCGMVGVHVRNDDTARHVYVIVDRQIEADSSAELPH